MDTSMEAIENAYQILMWIGTVFLATCIFACLILAINGPRFTDRIVAVNVICTKVVIIIAILSSINSDSGLIDIAIVYAMICFLAVVVLSKIYYAPHRKSAVETVENGAEDEEALK